MTRGIPDYGNVVFTTEAPLANVARLCRSDKYALAQRAITG
jgi:type I restriction enzyme S subunit